MGVYDTVYVPCPNCGEPYEAQSKSGDCTLAIYTLDDAPPDVLAGVNRHAPFVCDECGEVFKVELVTVARSVPCGPMEKERCPHCGNWM